MHSIKKKRVLLPMAFGGLTLFLLAAYFSKTNNQNMIALNSPQGVPLLKRVFEPRKFVSNTSNHRINHIGFLKVHKAGSTTMQNMFFRYAIRHNLTLVLPKQGNYLYSKQNMLPVHSSKPNDIYAIHTVYSKAFFDSMLPKDSVYIGIVREPLDRMISAAYYYRDNWGFYGSVPKSTFIHSLINDVEKYDRGRFSHTRNSMGRDFGFPSSMKIEDKAAMESRLNSLEKEFQLVLVVEKFEESLVLMKRTLNWDLRDIIYVSSNSYKHEDSRLTDEEVSKFRKTNFLDYAIYERFSKIMEDKLSRQGPDFFEEVQHLKHTVDTAGQYCKSKTQTDLDIPESRWTRAFMVSRAECNLIMMKEPNLIAQLRRRHSS